MDYENNCGERRVRYFIKEVGAQLVVYLMYLRNYIAINSAFFYKGAVVVLNMTCYYGGSMRSYRRTVIRYYIFSKLKCYVK